MLDKTASCTLFLSPYCHFVALPKQVTTQNRSFAWKLRRSEASELSGFARKRVRTACDDAERWSGTRNPPAAKRLGDYESSGIRLNGLNNVDKMTHIQLPPLAGKPQKGGSEQIGVKARACKRLADAKRAFCGKGEQGSGADGFF